MCFAAKDTTSAGILVFETVLNQDATVGNGDTLTVTGNYSGLSGAASAAHIHGPADATSTAAVLLYLIPGIDVGLYAGAVTAVVLVGLAVSLALSFRYLAVVTARKGGR